MTGVSVHIVFSLYCMHLPMCAYGQTESIRPCWCTIGAGCNFSRVLGGPTSSNYKQENVALGKAVRISSVLQGMPNTSVQNDRSGCLAVNGNIGNYYYGEQYLTNPPNCFHSAYTDLEPFWEVDLSKTYTITEITVYPRYQVQRRMLNITITVDEQFCYKFSQMLPSYNSVTIECESPVTGRYVKMKKDKWSSVMDIRQDDYSINVCEFEVWVCKNGYFGKDCSQTCENCIQCDNYYGKCIKGCKMSYFGIDCNQRCLYCLGSTCKRDGTCLFGCDNNLSKDKCNETVCRTGFYGEKCENGCPHCFDKKCDSNGACLLGCANGWKGEKCNEACRVGYYGRGCTQTCFTCLDKKCRVNGYCISGCQDGWIGDTCTTAIYSERAALLDDGLESVHSIAGAIIAVSSLAGATIILMLTIWSKQSRNNFQSSFLIPVINLQDEEIMRESSLNNYIPSEEIEKSYSTDTENSSEEIHGLEGEYNEGEYDEGGEVDDTNEAFLNFFAPTVADDASDDYVDL